MARSDGWQRAVRLVCALGFLTAGSGAWAERVPLRIELRAETERGVETRVFRDIQGRFEPDGSFTGAVQTEGPGWKMGAVLRGYIGAPGGAANRVVVPRGTTGTVQLEIDAALGFINTGNSTANFSVAGCIDMTTNPNIGPPIVTTTTNWGGSIAGGFTDSGGDGVVTVTNDSSANPIYELRTKTGTCAGATEAVVETLYDSPAGPFTTAGAFGSANINEAFFGAPIPGLAAAPT